jgi:hypothetical protein
VSAATSRCRTSLRPSQGRARGRHRLGVRAAPSRAHGPARQAPRPIKPPPPPRFHPRHQTLVSQRRRRPLPSRRCRPAPSPPCRQLGATPELRLKVRSTPVPSARVPAPCSSPSALATVRRRAPNAPPRGPPPPSPTRLCWCLGWISCVASFALIQNPSKTATPSPRTDRPAGAPPLAAGIPPLPACARSEPPDLHLTAQDASTHDQTSPFTGQPRPPRLL